MRERKRMGREPRDRVCVCVCVRERTGAHKKLPLVFYYGQLAGGEQKVEHFY